MKKPQIALSIKQPWATLIVAGLKSIEVRGWSTSRRGRIYIHASKVADRRAEAWKHVPKRLLKQAAIEGGIIGSVELTGCVEYGSPAIFTADRMLHLNETRWFKPPRLYGLVVTRPKVEKFRAVLGNVKFFTVLD